jgi:2-methylcitrate dehydratase PrpD
VSSVLTPTLVRKVRRGNPSTKRTAAVLAQEGVTGPPTVLEGRFGFFQAYLDGRYDEGAMLDGSMDARAAIAQSNDLHKRLRTGHINPKFE